MRALSINVLLKPSAMPLDCGTTLSLYVNDVSLFDAILESVPDVLFLYHLIVSFHCISLCAGECIDSVVEKIFPLFDHFNNCISSLNPTLDRTDKRIATKSVEECYKLFEFPCDCCLVGPTRSVYTRPIDFFACFTDCSGFFCVAQT